MEDEGRPLGVGVQAQASNHPKLLCLRGMVVSVGVKASGMYPEQVRIRESNESEPSMTRRNPENCRQNRGRFYLPGQACRAPDYRASGGRRIGGENLIQASVWNCGNQSFRCQGRSTSGRNHEARVPMRSTGVAARFISPAPSWGKSLGKAIAVSDRVTEWANVRRRGILRRQFRTAEVGFFAA
mgnify:CR=1 FL=1